MRKAIIISIVFLILLGLFAVSPATLAANDEPKLEINWPSSPLGTPLTKDASITVLVKYLYEWGIGLGGLAAFIALIIAGFGYLTSAGNAGKMRDAMSRIQSAGIGLVLLLASVLILNTINPQLTKIKLPELPTEPGAWTIDFQPPEKVPEGTCDGVQLYGGVDGSTPIGEMIRPGPGRNIDVEVLSVKFYPKATKEHPEIKSNCQLTLYRLSGFKTNADNPTLVILGDVKDMNLYGETNFRSAKVSNYQY